MILELFIPLVVLSLILIVLGFFFPSHSEYLIIGFTFMFLLALMMNQGTVEYKVGATNNASFTYTGGLVSNVVQQTDYQYTTFNDTNSHRFGLYLAIASAIGFAVTLVSIGKTRWGGKNE